MGYVLHCYLADVNVQNEQCYAYVCLEMGLWFDGWESNKNKY